MAEHTYDRGGGDTDDTDDNGMLTVEIGRFYGEDYVSIELAHGATFAYLTAGQACAVAMDLLKHANRLDPPKVQINMLPPREPDPGYGPGHLQAEYERGRRQGRYEAGG